MYLQTHGPRSLDPYRTLRLHRRAPRELVVEVYWALVSRTGHGDAQTGIAPGEMSEAYALLMDDDRRRQYDAANPDGATAPQPADDCYAVLHVDREADAGIIDAAYSFLRREGRRRKRAERQAIEEAYRILSNPPLRAQYDAATEARVPRPATAGLAVVDRPAGDMATNAPETTKRRGRGLFGRRRSGDETLDARDQRLLGLRAAALASMPEPAAAPREQRALRTAAVAEIVFVGGPQAGLRVPLDGGTVTLGGSIDDGVTLAGISRPSCLSVWRHGERFMLREGTGAGTLVAGRLLALGVVVLDDGDEITLDAHQMRFRLIRAG